MFALHPKHESRMDCPAGYQYYTCAISSFEGCCSIDPCKQSSACPLEYQPAFSMSPESTTSVLSSAISESTAQPLSSSTTSTVAASETATPTPITSTNTNTTSSAQADSSSSNTSHAGLIAGLVAGLLVVLLLMGIILFKLWRRRQAKRGEDAEAFPLSRLFHFKTCRSSRAVSGPPGTNQPPTSAVPLRRCFPEARSGRTDDGDAGSDERSGTDPRAPLSTAGATASRRPNIRAVLSTPSQTGPAGAHPPGAWAPSVSSHGAGGDTASLAVSSVNSSPGRQRDSGMDTTWVDSELEHGRPESPPEFQGLSAPPRSRNGPSPGSGGNQAG